MCYCFFCFFSLQNPNDAVMLSEQEPNNETREALSFLRANKALSSSSKGAELEATPPAGDTPPAEGTQEAPALSFFGYKQHLKCVASVGSILGTLNVYGREEECAQACLDYGAECVGFEFLYEKWWENNCQLSSSTRVLGCADATDFYQRKDVTPSPTVTSFPTKKPTPQPTSPMNSFGERERFKCVKEGDRLKVLWIWSEYLCAEACVEYGSACVAFEFHYQIIRCYLSSSTDAVSCNEAVYFYPRKGVVSLLSHES